MRKLLVSLLALPAGRQVARLVSFLIFLLVSLMTCQLVFAESIWFSPPEKKDIALEAIWQGLHVVDWGQTLDIARQPERFHEVNPLIGHHPSVGRVNTYMVASALVHPLISYALPKPYRTWWQLVSITVSAGLVTHNINVGLKVRF